MAQQFCLKWNNHTSNMLSVFEELLTTEAFVDVTLACDGLSIKAHKVVLSACSHYFQSLFLENPCKHPIVIMKDVSYKDLKAIIDFMYHGEVNVSQDQLSTLLKTAEMLKVKGLAEVTGEKGGEGVQGIPSTQTPAIQSSSAMSTQQRIDASPTRKRRKRGRQRHRSDSDSSGSDDESSVPSKSARDPPSVIEELSGDNASMNIVQQRATPSSSRSSLPSSTGRRTNRLAPSVNTPSSSHHQNVQHPIDDFEIAPTKLLEQTLVTDTVPSTSGESGRYSMPASTSSLQISEMSASDSQALVPSGGGDSNHMEVKQEVFSIDDDDPSSPIPGPSGESEDMSVMLHMDDSMSGQGYQDNQGMVVQDPQSQGTHCFCQTPQAW